MHRHVNMRLAKHTLHHYWVVSVFIGMVLDEDLMVVVLTIVLPTIGPRSVAPPADDGSI